MDPIDDPSFYGLFDVTHSDEDVIIASSAVTTTTTIITALTTTLACLWRWMW